MLDGRVVSHSKPVVQEPPRLGRLGCRLLSLPIVAAVAFFGHAVTMALQTLRQPTVLPYNFLLVHTRGHHIQKYLMVDQGVIARILSGVPPCHWTLELALNLRR